MALIRPPVAEIGDCQDGSDANPDITGLQEERGTRFVVLIYLMLCNFLLSSSTSSAASEFEGPLPASTHRNYEQTEVVSVFSILL